MAKQNSKHVLLIVEDDEDDYFLITSTLKKMEFEVLEALHLLL